MNLESFFPENISMLKFSGKQVKQKIKHIDTFEIRDWENKIFKDWVTILMSSSMNHIQLNIPAPCVTTVPLTLYLHSGVNCY